MRNVLMAVLAAVLLVSTSACRDDRNDETGSGERQERIDTVRGTPPER